MIMYLARDEMVLEDERTGHLHLFYDTPAMGFDGTWGHARKIADLESCMYPDLESGKCVKLVSEEISFEGYRPAGIGLDAVESSRELRDPKYVMPGIPGNVG